MKDPLIELIFLASEGAAPRATCWAWRACPDSRYSWGSLRGTRAGRRSHSGCCFCAGSWSFPARTGCRLVRCRCVPTAIKLNSFSPVLSGGSRWCGGPRTRYRSGSLGRRGVVLGFRCALRASTARRTSRSEIYRSLSVGSRAWPGYMRGCFQFGGPFPC